MRSAFDNMLPETIAWRKDKIGYEPPQNKWLQNKKVEEKIHENKRKLYKNNIISKKEFEKNVLFDNNKKWEIWMAGEMFT